MTYNEVRAIIGADGKRLMYTNVKGSIQGYVWSNADDASVALNFDDGKLVHKIKLGRLP